MESTFTNKELEKKALKIYSNSDEEIVSFEFENQTYWLKKARKTSSNLFHKICYKLFSYEVLIPVKTKYGKEAVKFESEKLKQFNYEGISVPPVFFVNDDFFVMGDTGTAVYGKLKQSNITSNEFYYYLDKVIKLLCDIHNKGFFHGGAQTRNFTYENGTVSAIDLEDSFNDKVDITTLQYRDLLLLLLSMTKVDNFKVNYTYIIKQYVKATGHEDFIEKLKSMSKELNFLIRLNHNKTIHNIFPRDVKGFCSLLEELRNLELGE